MDRSFQNTDRIERKSSEELNLLWETATDDLLSETCSEVEAGVDAEVRTDVKNDHITVEVFEIDNFSDH